MNIFAGIFPSGVGIALWIVLGVAELLLLLAILVKKVWLYGVGVVVGAVGVFVCVMGASGIGLALLATFGAVCALILLSGLITLLVSSLNDGGLGGGFYF